MPRRGGGGGFDGGMRGGGGGGRRPDQMRYQAGGGGRAGPPGGMRPDPAVMSLIDFMSNIGAMSLQVDPKPCANLEKWPGIVCKTVATFSLGFW
jgi:hypothetical protein